MRRRKPLRKIVRTPEQQKADARHQDAFEWRLHAGRLSMKDYDELPREIRDQLKQGGPKGHYILAPYVKPEYEKHRDIKKTIEFIKNPKNWRGI